MTAEFDMLAAIQHFSEKNPRLKAMADWLADICVAEASRRKKGWSFENWKNTPHGQTQLAVHGEEALRWEFLDDCHDILDHHGGFHHKVFSRETVCLISLTYKLFSGSHVLLRDIKQCRRRATEFLNMARSLGIEENNRFIKLRDVDGNIPGLHQ